MSNMTELINEVTSGLKCHGADNKCLSCPYTGCGVQCSTELAKDTMKVIDYYKGKYEMSLLATPPMIINHSEPIRIEPVDVLQTLKAAKAMDKMAVAADRAADALDKATIALRKFREEKSK